MAETRDGAADRRGFLKRAALAGAGLSILPAGTAFGQVTRGTTAAAPPAGGGITEGDAAILRFLAAAELLETDAWEQYNDFAQAGGAYAEALEVIDDDMGEYIEQNTDDEVSHHTFLNALLVRLGKRPVSLEPFRTLPSSPASPTQAPRLTNLMHLNVDTSWYLRYRSEGNPDLGDTFGQVVDIVNRPGIPVQPEGQYTDDQMQAIANTAAFHFGMLEQGGSSLYDALTLKCARTLTRRIVTSIGGAEVVHFSIWNDTAGGVPAVDSGDGLVFPDLERDEATDPEKVMPRPCAFLSRDLPLCSVIRPTGQQLAGAEAAIRFFTDTGLFAGQSRAFFNFILGLARRADAAFGGG